MNTTIINGIHCIGTEFIEFKYKNTVIFYDQELLDIVSCSMRMETPWEGTAYFSIREGRRANSDMRK